MLLPGAAASRAALAVPARSLELRTILARTIELRPLAKRAVTRGAVLARLVETGLVKTSRAIAGRARVASRMVRCTRIALLPRLGLAAPRPKILAAVGTAAEILARTAIRRAA